MLVRIPTSKGDLEIDLFETGAPLACRCIKQQLSTGVWSGTSIIDVDESTVHLRTTRPTAAIGRESHRVTSGKRGLVAFGEKSTGELVFCRQTYHPRLGTIFGHLTPHSLFVLEDIANGPKQGNKLLYPVYVGTEPVENSKDTLKQAAPASTTPQNRRLKRKLNIRLADERSDQLKQVLEFESRLKSVHKDDAKPEAFVASKGETQ